MTAETSRPAAEVIVARADAEPASEGAAANFTGKVLVTSRFQRSAPARIGGGTVMFEPGARTAWHTHPLGQTLFVTEGMGFVQRWNGAKQDIRAGDVVWIPPGVKHWHGATKTNPMTHIAIAEALDGSSTEWLEHVVE